MTEKVIEEIQTEYSQLLKNRQGRSNELRIKLKNERKDLDLKMQGLCFIPRCKNCSNSRLIIDNHSSELICVECGMVVMYNDNESENLKYMIKNNKKTYERIVHYQQRIAQLTLKDPKVPDLLIYNINKFMEFHNLPYWSLNKKLLSHISKICGYKRNFSSNILQIKQKLGYIYDLPELPSNILYRMKCRFLTISLILDKEWNQIFHEESNKTKRKRKNILNLNYILLQLFQLEIPEYIKYYGIYLPQLKSTKQPMYNNKYWYKIMTKCKEYCTKEGFRTKIIEQYGFDICDYEWPYIPITLKIHFHCNQYHMKSKFFL